MNAAHASKNLLSASLVALGLAVAPLAHAAQSQHLPPEKTQGAVTYRSGGIGENEAKAMQRIATRYPLELEFVAKTPSGHDEYLAGEKVVIKDQAGKTMLDAKSDGPFLLAKLPPGKYTVTASRDGNSKEREVVIAPHKHERSVFEW